VGDWSVLARQDPAPGDPGQVRALGARLLGEAERIDGVLGRSRALSAGDGALRMDGDYAPKFREALAALPEELGKLGSAYRACGSTLAAFASSLQDAQSRAGSALRQGIDAESRYQAAMREVHALLPPDRAATFSNGLGLRPASVDAATVGLEEQVRAQVRAAAHRAAVADEDLDRARRLADQAEAVRDGAESRCVKGIRDALEGSGIKNKPWWQKAWNATTTPFRSWDEFVKLAGKVALVAGIAAMFISGPVGWALMAGALVAGAAVFAGDLDRFARGEVGLGTLAFSALGLIPGGRGVIGVATLGRSVAGMAHTVTGGGGRLLVAGLRTGGTRLRPLATAFPHALGVSDGLRRAVRDPRLFARAFTCRFTGRDPIDLATGEMVMQMTDVELPGLLPLVVQRTYSSAYAAFGVGRWFGAGWSSLLDQRLEVDAAGVCLAFTEAVVLTYPHVTPGQTALPAEGPRLPLSRTADGQYTVHDPATGRTMTFAPPPDEPATAGPGVVLPLAAISDRNGHRMDLLYDTDDGSLAQIRHSGGYVVDVDTDHGLITGFRLRGHAGRDVTLVRYGYDDTGHLTEVINSSGLPLRFSYDTDGRMTSWEDRNGTWYRYTYDQAGRVVRTSGSARCLDGEIRYDTAGRVTVEVDSLGHATSYRYNDAWQIERVVNPLGHATSYEWDRYDRKLSQTDPLGRTTHYAYDCLGNLGEVTRPDGHRRVIERNERHQPVRVVVEPDGATSSCEYDDAGNLTAATDPNGATTRYGYDSHGRPATVTDAVGHTTRLQTNPAGLPIAITDPLGATTRIERDDLGRVIAVTDPTGAVTRYDWTVEGRLAARVLPDGATETWRYDAEGNLVEHSDALGQATRTDLTYFDLPAVRTQPDGSQVACTYDTELRLTSITDARGRIWRYDYDTAGRLIRETDYDSRVLRYRYDAAGQLIARVNGAGQVTTLTYDTVGNVVRRQAGDDVTVMTYDTAGRLVRATGPDADLEFERDPLGRVLAETVNGRTLTSSYDPLGRRVTRRTPSGIESHWEYDPSGRPAALTTADRRISFARDAAGRETARHLGTVAALHQTWDAAARLTTQSLTTGAPDGDGTAARSVRERTFQYRADGHITAIEDRRSGLRTFDLDALGRVVAVTGPQWRERYDYDPAGNLVAGDRPAPHAGRLRYSYDGDGRVIQRELVTPSGSRRTWHYRWNAEGRLVGVTTPDGARWRYLYDALARRIAKQRLGDDDTVIEQIDFTWDATRLAEQATSRPGGASTITTWEWEPNSTRPLTQHERESAGDNADQDWIDRQFHAIVTDLVGTPTDLVDETGTVTPQGAAPLWDAAPPDAPCPLRFPGQYHDAESGLHYNLFRHYDPATAAYTSPDPLGLIPGPNPRHYVPNPLTWLDPLGLAPYRPGGEITAWPPNNGFHGAHRVTVLTPGTLVDRFGYEGGRFVAPNGTPIQARSLAPGSTGKPYTIYEVTNRLVVQHGPAEPWFGQSGMGIQYYLPASVRDLLDVGYLRQVS
jgi:RHS repeat-associated protein